MAPKSQPKSVPKAVQAIRGLMGDTEITADSLKSTLSAAAYNNLCNNFRNQLTTEHKADYEKVGVVEARSWIAQFVLDPELCKCQGYNRTEVSKGTVQKDLSAWIYESQLAGPEYLNSAEMARDLVESKELDDMESPFKMLRVKGHKLYYFTKEMLIQFKKNVEVAGVEARVDVTADEYQKVRDDMVDAVSKPVTKKPRVGTKEKVEETAEQKEMKAAGQVQQIALRKLKAQYEKVRRELAAAKELLPTIKAKEYPEEMIAFMLAKIETAGESTEHVAKFYGTEITREQSVPLEEVKERTRMVEKKTRDLDVMLKEMQKGTIVDLKNLAKTVPKKERDTDA